MDDQLEAIATERLRLREPRHADAARLAVLANDFDVARMTTSMPFPYTRADADAFLERMAARNRNREAVFAIEHADEGAIGILGFHPKDGAAPEIGYWIGRPYWGRGLATEAVRAALEWADGAWASRWTIAGHFADNPASGRVLDKAGFLYTGEVKPLFSKARATEAPTRMMVRLA
ncbi:MAG TPA: GNAT family N-acetyltransferase [Caulobacteraceae bacterium]|nr:GNAT family N-acetyltransferase [Caulobacteraceae bacterium]